MYLAPVFLMIGGGSRVTTALLFGTLVDVISLENRQVISCSTMANFIRTTSFSFLESATLISKLISPPIGSLLMTIRLSVPFIFCIGCFASAFIPTYFLSTKRPGLRKHEASEDRAELEPLFQIPEDEVDAVDSSEPPKGYSETSMWRHVAKAWRMLTMSKPVMLGLAASFLLTTARSSMYLFLQYVSKRFQWTMAQVIPRGEL